MNSYIVILLKIVSFAYLTNYSINLIEIYVGKLWYNKIWLSQVSSGLPTMCNWFDDVAKMPISFFNLIKFNLASNSCNLRFVHGI